LHAQWGDGGLLAAKRDLKKETVPSNCFKKQRESLLLLVGNGINSLNNPMAQERIRLKQQEILDGQVACWRS
jgi:hypothetical protein